MLPQNSDLSFALEALCEFSIFERQSAIRRTSDLMSKSVLAEDVVLPKNTMLHLLDNFGKEATKSTDVPDVKDYPILQLKHLKYGNHFYDFSKFDKEDLNKFGHRIYRSGMQGNIRKWIRENRSVVIPTPNIGQMVDNRNLILVTNYNPLYRLITLTDRPLMEYYRYKAIFKTVLRQATSYDRQNFLVIPIPVEFAFDRANLMSMISTNKISGQKLASTNHFYFFILDLMAWLIDNQSELSTLNSIPIRQLGMLNVILTAGDRIVAFNFGKLAVLANSKVRAFNFANHIVSIAPKSLLPKAEIKIVEDTIETPELSEDKTIPAEVQISKVSRLSPDTLGDDDTYNDDDSDPYFDEIEQLEKLGDEELDDNSGEDEDSQSILDDVAKVDISLKPSDKAPLIEPVLPDEDDTESQTFIDRKELTPLQVSRAEKLAERYKEVVVKSSSGKTKTLNQLLTEPVEMNIVAESFTNIEDQLIDTSMAKSTVHNYDRRYQDKLLQKDIVKNLVTFKDSGLYLTNYEEKEEFSSHTRVRHYRAQFQDAKGKRHTILFKIPVPDDEGYYQVDGVKLSMSKQLVNVPICKISPTRVSLISNYNKTLVDKVQSARRSLPEFISKNASELDITAVPKANNYVGIEAPYEYRLLGSKFSRLVTKEVELFFEYSNRYSYYGLTPEVKSFESKYGVLCGRRLDSKDTYLFVDDNNLVTEVNLKTRQEGSSQPLSLQLGNFNIPAEWCELKILDRNLPIIFILGYRFGLRNILNQLKAKGRFVSSRQSLDLSNSEIAIPFKNGKLVIDRYPLITSYIVSGLLAFPSLKRYDFNDLDDRDTYYHLLTDKGMSTNYLKGIDNHFDFFIDPITKEILEEMKEPTNTRDLLIRAVEMLLYEPDQAPSSLKNFRLRSSEKIPGIIYNEISRQYANYVNSNFKELTFSINTEAVYQRILQDQTMVLREDLNPIGAIKEQQRVTYTGFGGRSQDAFVERDRRYPKDAIGILSETTTDSGSVGMVSALSGNPKIKNLRGMFDFDDKVVNTTQALSDPTLLMPGVTHDDPKRANFVSTQISHHVPTKNQKPSRLRTGYELIIPYKTSRSFIGKASQSGKIVKIDDELKVVVVEYKDKTTETFTYGEYRGESPGLSVNHNINLMPSVKVGKSVKPNEIISYHRDYFNLDPITNELAWCHGIPATIAISAKDVTLEDSSMISIELAKKLELETVYNRPILATTDMVVTETAKIGQVVSHNDPLVKLQYQSTADLAGEADELFEDLRTVEYRSKHEGVIVDIQIFHVAEILNDSLSKFISKATQKHRRIASVAKNSRNGDRYQVNNRVEVGTRIKGYKLGESDILIVYYIKSLVSAGIGDKIVFDGALKSVVSKVSTAPILTEDGEKIDGVFSLSSVFNRMILSVILQGVSDRILKQAEQDVIKMYFED